MSDRQTNEEPLNVSQDAQNIQSDPTATNTQQDTPATTGAQTDHSAATDAQQDQASGVGSTSSSNTASVPKGQQHERHGPRGLQTYHELCEKIQNLLLEDNTYFYIGGTDKQEPVGQCTGPRSNPYTEMLKNGDLLKRDNDGFYFTTKGGTSKKELIDMYLKNTRCLNRKRGEEKQYKCIYVMVYKLNCQKIIRKLINLYITKTPGNAVELDSILDIFHLIGAPEE